MRSKTVLLQLTMQQAFEVGDMPQVIGGDAPYALLIRARDWLFLEMAVCTGGIGAIQVAN